VFARYPLVLERGEGPYVYDIEGKKYLDFLGGIAVNILGHAHPKLVAAVAAQAAKLIHVSNLYYTVEQTKLAKTLVELTGLDRAFICNSGGEANEGAINAGPQVRQDDRRPTRWRSSPRTFLSTAGRGTHTATGQPKYRKERAAAGRLFLRAVRDLAALARHESVQDLRRLARA
jgi:acetylornithine/N-succinyldiaminopimelate aminotransferase